MRILLALALPLAVRRTAARPCMCHVVACMLGRTPHSWRILLALARLVPVRTTAAFATAQANGGQVASCNAPSRKPQSTRARTNARQVACWNAQGPQKRGPKTGATRRYQNRAKKHEGQHVASFKKLTVFGATGQSHFWDPPKGQVARQFLSTWLPPMQPSAQQPSPAQQPSAQHKPSPAAVGTAAEPSPAQPRPAAQPRARTLRRLAKSSFMSTCNHHGHRGAHMHARICASAVQESLIEGEQTLLLSKFAALRNFTRDSQEADSNAVSLME